MATRASPSRGQAQSTAIFWAEDALDDQFLIRAALEDRNLPVEVTFFLDGRALLDALAQRQPARVVLDINMPGLGGIETLQAIRQRPTLRRLPVTMFSTAMRSRDVEACKMLEVDAFVQKPSDFEAFAEAVIGIVSGQIQSRRAAQARSTVLAIKPSA
jgi:CheY-like chemotaxis protein